MSTFYLVHGAMHGAWCWYKVVAQLQARGHRVIAPDTIGHGLDRTPTEDTTLEKMVNAHLARLDTIEGKVILVGHSFGGTLITQIGEERPEKIEALVYVAAMLPPNGKTTLDMTDPEARQATKDAAAPDGGAAGLEAMAWKEVFYNTSPDEDIALAGTLLVPTGVAALTAPVSTSPARWGSLPRFYVECLEDRAIALAAQRRMVAALPCRKVMSLKTDHSPFFSAPEALTDCLTGLS